MSEQEESIKEITFKAYLPATQTAIQRHGAGNGMRITLEVPESEMRHALSLLIWVQENFEVTIKKLPRKKAKWS